MSIPNCLVGGGGLFGRRRVLSFIHGLIYSCMHLSIHSLISCHCIPSHSISFQLIPFLSISFHVIPFHSISFHFFPIHSQHFISFQFHFVASHFIPFHFHASSSQLAKSPWGEQNTSFRKMRYRIRAISLHHD